MIAYSIKYKKYYMDSTIETENFEEFLFADSYVEANQKVNLLNDNMKASDPTITTRIRYYLNEPRTFYLDITQY